MGRISIADDIVLNRTVAIKELLKPDGRLVARFRRELALTARLQHPSIVSVHDGGIWPNGELVYVMKLVVGEPLDCVIAKHASVVDRIGLLQHGIAVAEAIAYAHAQGIIHRDLKPANILVGDFGETVVIDWGLAVDLREAPADVRITRATVMGEVVGTPAYMPLEQASGGAVDERADVYAIGAVLYHLFAGVAPYAARANEFEVIAAVIDGPPVPLAQRAPEVPADLLAIVDKAMARLPEDRYATAGALAADLKRFSAG